MGVFRALWELGKAFGDMGHTSSAPKVCFVMCWTKCEICRYGITSAL